MAEKFYHICGRAYDNDGKMHIVTVVGKVKQGSEKVDVKLDANEIPILVDKNGHEVQTNDLSINFKEKRFSRELEIGVSICHPLDKFDEGTGVRIAKSRIKNGDIIGTLKTNDLSMLTQDGVYAELLVKLNHIKDNIEKYIS